MHLSQAFVLPASSPPGTKNGPAFFNANALSAHRQDNNNNNEQDIHRGAPVQSNNPAALGLLEALKPVVTAWQSGTVAMAILLATCTMTQLPATATAAADTTAASQTLTCLLQKCRLPLAKCIANPKCLLNVACINTCNGRSDEIECQIQCGDKFENKVVGEFNKCAVSDMDCVKQKPDDGSYPVPKPAAVVESFDTNKFFKGRWYITAGQNPLFDIFPCQVHFFELTGKNSFVGKLNWRIEEPDGEYFTRDALQAFVQDPAQAGHMLNHDNEYLHYQDDWWIIDYEYDNNDKKVPPFAFVYYRGSNDAWDGYGGVVVYTRVSKLPDSLKPRLRAAAAKVNMDYDKDFSATDNTCPTQSTDEKTMLREQFAGKVALQTEQQLQAAATRFRGNAVNSVKAQKLFFNSETSAVEKAFLKLDDNTKAFEDEVVKAKAFEKEVVKDAQKLEGEVVKDAGKLEKEVVKSANKLEKEVVKDADKLEKEAVKLEKEVVKQD
jgi:violaxanthin de-epoxidase